MRADHAGTDDRCPHCRVGFEVLHVKFGLTGARLLAVCPNCSLAQSEPAVARNQNLAAGHREKEAPRTARPPRRHTRSQGHPYRPRLG